MKMSRHWINQPSTTQPLHDLNGSNVIGPRTLTNDPVTIYFTSGDIISMIIKPLCLSPGWRKPTPPKEPVF